MWTRLLRCFSAILLVLSLALPFAAGQGDTTIQRGVKLDPSGESNEGGSNTAALPFFVMAIYSMLVLTIVFMPSRQA